MKEYVKRTYGPDQLPNREYHAQDWAVSSSFLKTMASKSPYYAKWRKDNPQTSPALDFGTAFHTLVLEGEDKYRAELVTATYKTGKKALAEREEAHEAGKVALTADEQALCERLAANVAAHPLASQLLDCTKIREESMFWQDEETGVWCRCRPDAYGGFEIVDLKTCADIYSFEQDAARYGYLLQAAFYRRGFKALNGVELDFVFVAASKAEPHEVGVFSYDSEALKLADKAVTGLLRTYAECEANGVWPGAFGTETTMGLRYGQRRELERLAGVEPMREDTPTVDFWGTIGAPEPEPAKPEGKAFYTPSEIVAKTGLTRGTVYRLLKQGRFGPPSTLKYGRKWLVPAHALNRLD